MTENKELTCWCGNQKFTTFSDDYVLCEKCNTLILAKWADESYYLVLEDNNSFYGKAYWFEHQEKDLGYSSIEKRARTDLPERALYWIRTLLKYKTPSGSALEIGCAHGGFVSVLNWAGFEASGLELSPWVSDFAQNTFDIPMYTGDIGDQNIPSESLDVIVMMDVLEHLPDPVKTLETIRHLLKPDGILVIQTPCFPETREYKEMKKDNDPFLLQLKPPEHLFLFSKTSVKQLLGDTGFGNLSFEKAFFYQYDMFIFASPSPLVTHDQEEIDNSLLASPGGRLVLALFDIDKERHTLQDQLEKSEADRTARYEQIEEYRKLLVESDADRSTRFDQIQELNKLLAESESDRRARFDQIQQYSVLLEESEADRKDRYTQILQFQKIVEDLQKGLTEQSKTIESHEKVISELNTSIIEIKSNLLYKFLHRLGLWK